MLHNLLHKENIKYTEVDVGFDYDQLISGQIDAQWAFTVTAGLDLPAKGVEINVISPADYGLTTNTTTNYANDRARLTNFAYQAQKPIEHLQPPELRQFIAQLTQARLSTSRIRRIASTIHSFYAFLTLNHYIDTPPTGDLNTPSTTFLSP